MQTTTRSRRSPIPILAAALCALALAACTGDGERARPASSVAVTGAPAFCPAPATPPSVLVVDANPGLTPLTEIAQIEWFLTALGYPYAVIDEPRTAGASWYDDPGITPAQVAPYDIIIYDTKGWRWHSAESRDTLLGALAAGKRVFLIGDDTGWGIPGLEALTHLTGASYDNNGDYFPANTPVTVLPNTFLSAGPTPGVQSFTYNYDVDVATATNQGESILATVRNGAPAILSYKTTSGGRAIVSLVGISAAEGAVSTPAGLQSLANLFDNAMAHLAASGTCDAQCPPTAPLVGPDGRSCVGACPSGTYDDAGRCVAACPAFHTDTQCVDACPSGSFTDGNACVDACPSDRFIDGTLCVAQCSAFRRGRYCVNRCPAFHLGRLCVATCPVYSHRNACVSACPSGTFRNGTVCVNRCPPETAPNADGVCTAKIVTSVTVTTRSNTALIVGTPTEYRAIVRDANGALVRTGTVVVTIDGTQTHSLPVTNGVVDFSHTYATVGQHILRVNYTGQGYKASSFRDVFRTRERATAVAVSASVASPVAYQIVTYTAAVTAGNGAAVTSGTVTFSGPAGAIVTAAVDQQGRATANIWWVAGSTTLTAAYNPTTGYQASTGTLAVVVAKANTITTPTATPNPAPAGVDFMYDVNTVAAAPSGWQGSVPPPGWSNYRCYWNEVEFPCIGSRQNVPGTYVLRMDYLGTANFNPSSGSVTVVILP